MNHSVKIAHDPEPTAPIKQEKLAIRTKRITVVDAMRGASLLGILISNILIFQYGMWGKDALDLSSFSTLSQGAYYFIKIFIESSFMPIFSFLFGFSVVKMAESLARKQLRVKWHLFRRALFLLFAGFVHRYFLWEGDILFGYGLTCLILIMFVNRKAKTILIWGILFLTFLVGMMTAPQTMIEKDQEKVDHFIEETNHIYKNGTYLEIKDHRNNAQPVALSPEMNILFVILTPFMTSALFWFGMYAAKRNWFIDGSFRLSTGISITVIALALKTIQYIFPHFPLQGFTYIVGSLLLSVGYMMLFVNLYRKTEQLPIHQFFIAVGKLSLSNYLLQTVICITIFYGYGFGLFGKLGVFLGLLLSFVIFAFQMIGSKLYLKKFRSGPFEKVLRYWTYLRSV